MPHGTPPPATAVMEDMCSPKPWLPLAAGIRHIVGVSSRFLIFSNRMCGEILSDGTSLTKYIATPGGNFLMPMVIGLGRNICRGKGTP